MKKNKKVFIKNYDEFIKYFNREIQNIYIAKMTNIYQFEFNDGTVIHFILKNI